MPSLAPAEPSETLLSGLFCGFDPDFSPFTRSGPGKILKANKKKRAKGDMSACMPAMAPDYSKSWRKRLNMNGRLELTGIEAACHDL